MAKIEGPCITCGIPHTKDALADALGVTLADKVGATTKVLRWLTDLEMAEIWSRVHRGMTPQEAVNTATVANVATSAAATSGNVPGSIAEAAQHLADALRRERERTPMDETAVKLLIADALASYEAGLDESRVRELIGEARASDTSDILSAVQDMLDKATKPREIAIKLDNLPAVKIDGLAHESLDKIVRILRAVRRKNILLIGPAGTGKSTLARQITQALDLDPETQYGEIGGSAGLPEWKLIGRSVPYGDAMRYVLPRFVQLYRDGGVFLADELDGFDPNVLLVINNALANGYLHLEGCEDSPVIPRSAEFYFIGAANTAGTGADYIYVGRNQLDATTLDRFGGGAQRVWIDYSPAIEESVCPDSEIRGWVKRTRAKMADAKMRRVLTTRFLASAWEQTASKAQTWNEVREAFFLGWTRDERARVEA